MERWALPSDSFSKLKTRNQKLKIMEGASLHPEVLFLLWGRALTLSDPKPIDRRDTYDKVKIQEFVHLFTLSHTGEL